MYWDKFFQGGPQEIQQNRVVPQQKAYFYALVTMYLVQNVPAMNAEVSILPIYSHMITSRVVGSIIGYIFDVFCLFGL